ncbi:M50 family metallopeptidase [Actinokineospora sp. NBRC 105648]|uniref:M50 family metallopeptidase n=1 Tax=Actinokineospora sp. NBRC 105648 TaxID=3032206 RepID=UPI0025547E24|nr:M50 family metallopeptidase [Actinokineospora sp. NBRC 105648]
MVLVTAAIAIVLVSVNVLWRPARNVITIVHEAGHALIAVLAGRRLAGIRLHSDTSGVTVSRGKPEGPGMVCTALAGYVAPSLLGLGFAALLGTDRVTAVLVVCAVLLFGVLIMIRNVYGVFSIVATGAVLFGVSWLASEEIQAAFAYLIAWFLLLGGLRPVAELQAKRRRGHARDSDADQLARLTGAPGFFWVGTFALVNLGAVLLAAGWLLL